MENLVSNLREKLTGTSVENPSTTNDTNAFRRIQMPEMKIGLGSTEGDLVALLKKYLEIVGLVLFVWILGKHTFSFDFRNSSIYFHRLFSIQRIMDFISSSYLFISTTSTYTIQITT